jgi:DNA mismatch repair protein MutS
LSKYTPMFQQYLEIKEQYKDSVLFFRLGDFYEMFFEDAVTASQILNITLTGRDAGKEQRVPMCGVPYHSASSYIAKLINEGLKVAICEQVSDPSKSPGLVEREVIRVITPGTLVEDSILDAGKYNYIASIALYGDLVGLSYADVSTGLFRLAEFGSAEDSVVDEMLRLEPVELVVAESMLQNPLWDKIRARFPNIVINTVPSYSVNYNSCRRVLLEHFGVHTLDCFDCEHLKAGTTAAGMLLGYLKQLQKQSLAQLTSLQSYKAEGYMVIDSITRKHLELVGEKRSKKTTLFDILNFTRTSMGNRLLKEVIQQPLMDHQEIEERLDAVEELKNDTLLREKLADRLAHINDLERLASRVAFGQANTRDMLNLKESLGQIPQLLELSRDFRSKKLVCLRDSLDPVEQVVNLITKAIQEDCPSSLTEGNIIKAGYNEEVDRLRDFLTNSRQWLINMEARERQRTGIKSLKIKYNKVFGYFIEITKSNLENVPDDYIRKQTLVNSERFITEELKNFEHQAFGSEDRLNKLEYELFCKVREEIAGYTAVVQQNASAIAELDVLQSLAAAAVKNNYTRPTFNTCRKIKITEGRHPVVEKSVGEENFVPNDVLLNQDNQRIILLTGPNMSGKSTFLRQVALITLLGQIGSFVPAKKAELSLTDRIFTRIGASDDISTGRSTFMVEMSEVANILYNAGEDSLILLDEVGRGTATYDGLSLAWAIVEYLTTTLQAKTLFATHYHELTALADNYEAVKNYFVAAKEMGDKIAFLHKILPGKSDKSYGIQVAKLAGLPRRVVERAEEILATLETSKGDTNKRVLPAEQRESKGKRYGQGPDLEAESLPPQRNCSRGQSPLMEETATAADQRDGEQSLVASLEEDIISSIRDLELQNTTPLEALNFLYKIQQDLRKGMDGKPQE